MNSKYYNYSINMNGKKIKHGFDYHKDYYPDLIANDSIAFLRHSKKQYQHKPVMLTMSFPAPHGPEDSAPQYSHLFFNVTTHHTPSYDHAPNPDKQWILQVTRNMEPIHRQFTNLLMTKRLQTLQSVDAAVERVVNELRDLGELENTYIVYTSDHGYHLGQFGLIKGKSFPFEFDVRVPFLVRGPGITPGAVVDDIVLNIDLAPTFLHMAGVEPPPHMDGRSALPLLLVPDAVKRKRVRWPDTFLIESSGRRETPYLDQKLERLHKYSQAANFRNVTETPSTSTEAHVSQPTYTPSTVSSLIQSHITSGPRVYDSGEDPASLDTSTDGDDTDDEADDDEDDEEDDDIDIEEKTNVDTIHLPPINPLDESTMQLDNRLLPVPPYSAKLERLAVECMRDDTKLPCKRGQKWFCENDNGRWRRHKCKSVAPTNVVGLEERGYRKCACFTPDGLVYKKLPLNNMTRRDLRMGRIKRDVDLDNILFEQLGEEKIHKMAKRDIEDTLSSLEDTMGDVEDQIYGLRVSTNTSNEPTWDSNAISNPGCIITRGKINCSTVIYKDKKTWRQSRHRIENEIQQLRHKLETLKEIRRHLKNTRPLDESGEVNGTELNTFNELNFQHNSLPVLHNKEIPRPIPLDVNRFKKKRKNKPPVSSTPSLDDFLPESFNDSLEVNGTDFDQEVTRSTPEFTTAMPTMHSNPHRHSHHRTHSSTGSMGMSTTTPSGIFENRGRKTPTIPRPKTDELMSNPKKKVKQHLCHCEIKDPYIPEEKDVLKEEKRRLKEERLKKKLRKQRKKEQLEKECSHERMNCFHHDNDHWKTAPQWTAGPFCFCMNANNNTYSCVRTINSTHNFLYCEFTTGMVTFYNLRIDPFELQNRIDSLKPEERSYLHDQLARLVSCKGKSCTVAHSNHIRPKPRMNSLPLHNIGQYYRKRKYQDEDRGAVAPSGGHPRNHTVKHDTRGRDANINSTTIMRQQQGSLNKPGSKRRRRKS
ncbi:unnamed protein product [Acanthoscelides obtectus]|uniref:Uncharacterized protein n=1 Tax=Acanthoscelides obtectus TaxID=200917 RepID=A0A9P0M1E0_ACAOB|nr:unnamed protein product [Acanthoscelides obtectus]CAK1629847.1 Extracellular sulfatase SULF-1 homolog [Acanthoscelides obtectus]